MDRTVIAPYKAEEKELSDKLYKKLEGLMLLFPPSEEFRKCLTNDMFLKPNQAAFFQVMHYLFRLHDPVEFKKRFYWPITDKRSEACFRSATVEYLKFLSTKNQLNWNIKSYLAVMPGGMKFITFLLDLIGFIVQEQIRVREKQLGAEISQEEISELNLKRMQKQNTFFKEYASDYITVIDEQVLKLRNKTQKLKERLHIIESSTPNLLINKEFLCEFNEANKKLFEEKYINHAQNIISLEKPLNDLKGSIEKFQNKATELRKDKSNLKQSLQKIELTTNSSELKGKKHVIDKIISFETLNARIDSPDGPTMNSLVMTFVMVAPTIDNWIGNVIENIVVGSDVTSELFDLKTEFQQMEAQLIDFQKKHNPARLKNKEHTISTLSSSPLLLKYVFTPPIKLSVADNISTRLPLQDETNMLDRCNNYLANTRMNIRTVRKLNKDVAREQSFELNNTLNRSKKLDPVQLLHTIYNSAEKSAKSKKLLSQHRQNSSLLSLKWKERQEMMFGCDKEQELDINIVKTYEPIELINNISIHEQNASEILKETPKTPFNITNSGEITRIAVALPYEKSPSTMLLKKPPVVRKVQHTLLNIQDLSTSPSGRLEPLIAADDYASLAIENSNKFNEDSHTTDYENDANILNTPIRNLVNLSDINEDTIFNTSDTILKNIL